MTERRNQYGGPCAHCGGYVAEGEGTVVSVQDPATDSGYKRMAAHIGECPAPEQRAEKRAQAPLWAVPRRDVLTPHGNLASRAVALVGAPSRPTPDAVAVNTEAQATEGNGAATLEEAAASSAEGRAWLALWWLDGIRPRPAGVTMDDIDAMLGDADVGAMREREAREREAILKGER